MNKYKVSRWGSDLSSRKLTDFITSAFRLKSFTELQTCIFRIQRLIYLRKA